MITHKLNKCAAELTKWSHENCHKTRREIDKYRRKLEAVRNEVDAANVHYYNELRKKLDVLLVKDDLFWKQRAKTYWYRDGDLNTRFFHATASTRKKKNQIEHLEDPQGTVCNSIEGMKAIANDYFTNLFQQQNGERNSVINAVKTCITPEDNNALTAPFSFAEFREAIFSMEADKCPGPDGFSPSFYQYFWELCGNEIFKAGCEWLEGRSFPPNLNSTNIALIPKGDTQTSMKDWRPISLCNVLYKVIAKVLANRLKLILNKCISENQSAFVPGRSILDNAMAAIEIIHHMKSKTRGKKGDVALKLDISKAYDRIDWEFLKEMMIKMGFSQKWIGWIMLCVETVDYSVIINGHKVGPIIPGRGLRQGDPLSPYLFIICAEGLNGKEAATLKNILSIYEAASGQAINLQKSEFYCSRNVPSEVRESIANTLGVTQVLGTAKTMLAVYIGSLGNASRRVRITAVWVSKISNLSTWLCLENKRGTCIGHNPSYVWRSIWNSKHVVQAGCKWSIGTGENINVWEQNWLKDGMALSTPSDMEFVGNITKVHDLMLNNSKKWDYDKIQSMFDNNTANRIMQTPLFDSVHEDTLVWKMEHDGLYSVGIGMCIRDDQGCFVKARTEWIEPILDVEIGEAMGLLRALKWIDELQLHNTDVEVDCKRVVDGLNSKRNINSDFGAILSDCRSLLATNLVNSNVKFIRRQANEVAHSLARVATSSASFQNFIDIPTFLVSSGSSPLPIAVAEDQTVIIFTKFGANHH
ncbi:hypothetical protein TSUD_68650 [Trifolium subterraneum]|uniref:Reverse transcriptase domain-containing protein n=1 Tax=Trifolium subterraneum TaxID=3900 RepID=A0A2Z6N777_TRISU|nr:hypothetical protein TSUD_68650 [Trifolium subterraneum]